MVTKRQRLLNQIREIDKKAKSDFWKKHLPFRKSMAGTYHKYCNSSGSGEKWWYYSFVEKVTNLYDKGDDSPVAYFSGWNFQLSPEGKVEITKDAHLHSCLLEIQITKEEFYAAWNDAMAFISALPG